MIGQRRHQILQQQIYTILIFCSRQCLSTFPNASGSNGKVNLCVSVLSDREFKTTYILHTIDNISTKVTDSNTYLINKETVFYCECLTCLL